MSLHSCHFLNMGSISLSLVLGIPTPLLTSKTKCTAKKVFFFKFYLLSLTSRCSVRTCIKKKKSNKLLTGALAQPHKLLQLGLHTVTPRWSHILESRKTASYSRTWQTFQLFAHTPKLHPNVNRKYSWTY